MNGLRLALGFLTSLPVRPRGRLEAGDLGRAASWFPLVGLAIGAVLWAADSGATDHLPPLLVGGLVVGLWVVASGALHLDGLADCVDGMLASAPPARRLEIMADVHVGAFAVVGLVLYSIVKVAAVAALPSSRPLLLVPVLGRWWVLPLARMRPVRPGGLGDQLHAGLGWHWLPALAVSAGMAALLGWRGVLAFAASGLSVLLWAGLARARIGGQTGDVLGAACEWAELAALLAFVWR
jgi:adenosylcobinamide-GDP ribazoletransferase